MTIHLTLEQRAERCVRYAKDGNAVVLRVADDEKDYARQLVQGAPVIVANAKETIMFLRYWVHEEDDMQRARRRRR